MIFVVKFKLIILTLIVGAKVIKFGNGPYYCAVWPYNEVGWYACH